MPNKLVTLIALVVAAGLGEASTQTPAREPAGTLLKDHQRVAIQRTFCDAAHASRQRIGGRAPVLPYTFLYSSALRCADGTLGCWRTGPHPSADMELLVSGRMHIAMGLATTSDLKFTVPIAGVPTDRCDGVSQAFSATEPFIGTWRSLGGSGPFTGTMTLAGTIRGCRSAQAACYTVTIDQFAWQAIRQ
ncbi:MAG: hypothetical protein HY737_08630 [Candidatus Omnitrophica bacterium]|nr:hypothetical protein [Candidatus Omnitrophota bacterium]